VAKKKGSAKKKASTSKSAKSVKKKSTSKVRTNKNKKPEIKSKPKTKKKLKAKPKPKTKKKLKAKPKPKTKKKLKAKPKPKTKKKLKAKPKPKTKKKLKAKPKPKNKSKTKSKIKPKTTAKSSKVRIAGQGKVILSSTILKIRDQLVRNQTELFGLIQTNQAIERNTAEANFSNEIDMASSLEGREMMFQLTSRDRSELKMIQEALYKIDHGTYGICDACQKKISSKRLQILPLSSLCIECKESMEHI